MGVKINNNYNIGSEELRLRYAQMSNLRSAGPNVGKPRETSNIDIARINELAGKYAARTQQTESAAATVYAPAQVQPIQSPQAVKVDSSTAINNKSGVKTELPSALKFNAFNASNQYSQNAAKSKDLGVYSQLSNVKINEVSTNPQQKTNNPFANQYTGLSYMISENDLIA